MRIDEEEEGYVYVRREISVRTKIPEGHIKCKWCGGSGEVRIYWGQPWDRGQFQSCPHCLGKGHLEKEIAEAHERYFGGR